MRWRPGNLALLLILPAVSVACFHRLAAAPGALIVDGRRASVDHADRGHSRGIGNDLTTVFLPRFTYFVKHIRRGGNVPAWDDTGFGGRPLVGNPQAGPFYPPVWLAWWGGRPSALGWVTVAHLLWGGLGAYTLSRSYGFGRLAAVVAGGCFEASPYLVAQTFEGHYPHVWSACWYPWAFWGQVLISRRKPMGFWALPPVLALTFLTGHPQEWYYLVLALSANSCVDAVHEWGRGTGRDALIPVVAWAGLLAVSLGLSAIEVLPEWAAEPWSLKATVTPDPPAARYQLHAVNLFQLLNPFALGRPESYTGFENYWETLLSIGLTPLVLAMLGLTYFPDRGPIRRWGAIVAVCIVFAGGRKLGVYAIAYAAVPGMERFRVPARTLFLASLGASVLAGAGVQALRKVQWDPAVWRALWERARAGLVIVGILVVALAVFEDARGAGRVRKARRDGVGGLKTYHEKVRVGYQANVVARSGIFWGSLIGAFAALSAAGKGNRGPAVAGLALAAVALVELSAYAQSILVCAPAEAFLKAGVDIPTGDEGPGRFRVASVGATYPDLPAVAAGVQKTNVNDGFQIRHAAETYERLYPILDPASHRDGPEMPLDAAVERFQCGRAQAVMDLMGVRYLVAERAIPLRSVERVGHDLWRNRSELPRAYVVPRAVVTRDQLTDPRVSVEMARDPLPLGKRQPFLPAEWVADDPDVVTVRVDTTAPGLLVVGNTWMPGWSARVDSKPASVRRGNGWQQVIALDVAGRHEVVLRYEPPGLATGKAITAAVGVSWAGLGLLLAVRHLGSRRRSE